MSVAIAIDRASNTQMKSGWSEQSTPASGTDSHVPGSTPVHAILRRVLPLSLRWKLAEWMFQAKTQIRLANDLAREIGWDAVAKIRFAQQSHHLTGSRRLNKIHLPGYRYPLYYRQGSSDPLVIEQVFARYEYACVSNEKQVRFIIDCGANVGYTSFYLLSHYPHAKAIVVEPDSSNLAVCRKNLAPFHDRVHFVQAGIWGKSGPMKLNRSGAEWAFSTVPASPGEVADFQAVTITYLLNQYDFPHIDLLKVDIEGAEKSVFDSSPDWLNHTKTLVIELHGEECETSVVSALASHRYERSHNGELTVFRDISKTDSRQSPGKAGPT